MRFLTPTNRFLLGIGFVFTLPVSIALYVGGSVWSAVELGIVAVIVLMVVLVPTTI